MADPASFGLRTQQASGQQGTHIAASIRDEEYDDLTLVNSINNTVRLEVDFPEAAVPDGQKLSRIRSSLRQAGERHNGFFDSLCNLLGLSGRSWSAM